MNSKKEPAHRLPLSILSFTSLIITGRTHHKLLKLQKQTPQAGKASTTEKFLFSVTIFKTSRASPRFPSSTPPDGRYNFPSYRAQSPCGFACSFSKTPHGVRHRF